MIRHIFIGTFLDGVTAEEKARQLADMRAMKEKIPGVFDLNVGISTGWAGKENQVVMTVDFEKKSDFDVYMTHPYHADYIGGVTAEKYFDRSSFISAQFEVEDNSMNEVMKNLLERRSVRAFKPDAVPEDVLERIIKAGTYAASGMGKQSAIIVAVTNKELRDKLSVMNAKILGWGEDEDPFYGAPVVLVVLADKSVGTYLYDGSLVMGNLMNAAHAEGLGSCWIHRAKEEFESPEGKALLHSLGIEGDFEGVGHCVLGYAAQSPASPVARKRNFVYFVR